jgi:hypothetical protein
MMKRLLVCLLIAASSLSAAAQKTRLSDSSDWWSINRADTRIPHVKAAKQELQPSNFSVAGIEVGHGGVEAFTAKFGRATEVERGDASTGRSQWCYVSAVNNSVRAIFEFGEDESLFYLFSGGADWEGSKYCVKSKKISFGSSTMSGLRLGLTRAEVEAILGRPDAVTANELVYSREFQKRSSPQQFATLRKDYPEPISDEEAHRQFDFYPVEQYILARFVDSKLVYLAVATSGNVEVE